MKIKIIRFNHGGQDIKLPKRCFYNDSGADVFAAEDVTIQPHSVYAVPTGVGLVLPDGYDAVIHCKSGLSKKGIWASNAPIDSGYRGEIHAILQNTTDVPYQVMAGTKVGQLVVRPVLYPEFVDDLGEERGTGGFGSTKMV